MLAAVFWGANYAATKYAAEFMPPLLIVALRFTAGGILMFCLLRILEPADRLKPKDLLYVAGLGCLGVAIGQTAFTFGVSMTSAANTGLIFATAPIWGLFLSLMLGLERPTRRGMVGVGLSILGVGIVFYEGLGTEPGRRSLRARGGDGVRELHRTLDAGAGASLAAGGDLLLALRRAGRPAALFTVPYRFGVGERWHRSMGGCGLLGGLRHRFLLLGLANGRIPHRCQQSSGLPILDHHHGRCLRHRLL